MAEVKFYAIAEKTGAGDEWHAVDWNKSSIEGQLKEIKQIAQDVRDEELGEDDIFIYEITLSEYIQGLDYLGYDVKQELTNLAEYILGKKLNERKV